VQHRHVEQAATPPSSTWSTNQTKTLTCLPNFLISAERTVVAARYAEFRPPPARRFRKTA
jgi:hypothetical protein